MEREGVGGFEKLTFFEALTPPTLPTGIFFFATFMLRTFQKKSGEVPTPRRFRLNEKLILKLYTAY